jgi:ABC-type transport system involved in cytochrome c biogenesis permease subunit
MPKKKRRRKAKRNATELAAIVGMVLGGALGALQLQETIPRWSQVPESLFVIAHLTAVLLITAALTQGVRMGLLSGAMAAVSQFLTLIGFFTYSFGIALATYVVPLECMRLLTYPFAGVIGGYIGARIAEIRSVKSSGRIRRTHL